MRKVIESSGICKKFGETQALKDISFSVNESEIFGFIGPDGAGKTTLFRIITTLYLPDEGEMKVLGLDCSNEYKEASQEYWLYARKVQPLPGSCRLRRI